MASIAGEVDGSRYSAELLLARFPFLCARAACFGATRIAKNVSVYAKVKGNMTKSTLLMHVVTVLIAGMQMDLLADTTPSPRHDKTFRNLSVSVPKLPKAPTLDGVVDPAEWAGAGMGPRMVLFEREDRMMAETEKFYYGYTDDALWVAWQIQRPKEAIAPKAVITQPDKNFWHADDALEFMLNCRPHSKDRKEGRDFYMIWNALGTKYDRRDMYPGEVNEGLRWTGDWKAVSRTVPDFGWEGEARFPLAMLEGAEKPGPGVRWQFQLAENRATPEPLVALAGYQISWFKASDYPTMLFTGDEGVFARVLDSGAMTGKGGLELELVNPGAAARTIVPTLKFYKRKTNAASALPYLRAFDQARDTPENRTEQGKVALFIPDEQVSRQIIDENYTLVKERKDPLKLAPGERKTIDFTVGQQPGDYLVLYDVRYPEGEAPKGASPIIAGAPLPFVIPEPLGITTRNFLLVDKSIEVKADLRYVDGWDATSKIAAKVSPVGMPGKSLFEKQWTGAEARNDLTFDLPTRNAAPGKYQLQLTALNAAGKQLAERRTEINIPATPEWFSKPVGQAPVVPKPWVPIKVSGPADSPKLSFLMGDFALQGGVLPAQIHVRSIFNEKREPILRGPVRLHGVVDGQPVEWNSQVKLDQQKGEAVRASSTARAGNVMIQATGDFEFDGMEKIALQIAPAPGKQPAISQLTLSIPFAKGFADLYRPNNVLILPSSKVEVKPGKLPEGGVAHDWRPNVWIGNTRRGLEWFAENWRGWKIGNEFMAKAIEVENSPEGATLHVHFIRVDPAKPLVLDKPRDIIFGMMFTPPKTINPHPVRIGSGFYNNAEGHAEKLPADVAAGLNATEVWIHHDFNNLDRHLQGWWDQSPERTAELKELGKTVKAQGIKVLPYSGWYLSRNAQVYPTWGAEMVVDPLIDGGLRTDVNCWNTPVSDAYLYTMRKAAKETGYDGFRMDAGFALHPCSSLKHRGYGSVCGWYDDAGNLQPSVPIFAAREAAKRAYRMFHSADITEDGLCLQHIHGAVRCAPILSFIDGVVSAEGAELTAQSSKEFDVSFWRAAVMEDKMGLQVIYWPKADRFGNDTRLGISVIHRFTPRSGGLVVTQDPSYSRTARPAAGVWLAEDWVRWLDPGTEFYGYWENSQFLQTGRPTLYGSIHVRRGEKLLLGLFNHDTVPVEQAVRLDLKALGFNDKAYALDAITGEPIELKDGAMTLDLTAESFRLVKIATQPFAAAPQKIGDNLAPEIEPAKWPAQGAPAGWKVDGDVAIVKGEIVFRGKANTPVTFGRSLPLASDKHYVLEAEVRVDCDEGPHLGPDTARHTFGIVFGRSYEPKRTLSSQLPPDRYETLKLYWDSTKDNSIANTRIWLDGNGKAYIRRIGIYEVDRARPLFDNATNGTQP